MTAIERTFSKKEYDDHVESLYQIGKSSAFQSVLKTEVNWSVWEKNQIWDLDTVVIGDGTLKNIPFVKQVYTKDSNGNYVYENVNTIAKNGTIKEIWLAADRAYKKAKKLYGDWHYFLEMVELKNGVIYSYYGS